MLKSNIKKSKVLLFICVFVFLGFVMWCTPFSSDDYEFAALKFEGLHEFFSYILFYGNGRVLGNVLSISLVHMPMLAVAVKAFLVTSVIFLIPAVLKLNHVYACIISFVLLIGINPVLFGEVYTWTCGFSNYIPPVWLTLTIIYLIQHYQNSRNLLAKLITFVLVPILGVASQLFVEHATVIHVLLSAFFVIKHFKNKKHEKGGVLSVAWLVSTLIGAVLMFAVPLIFYHEGNRSTGYRSFNLGGIAEMIYSCARNTIKLGNNYMGTTGLVICFAALLTAYMTRSSRSEKGNRVLYTLASVPLVFLLVSSVLSMDSWYGHHAMLYHAISAVVMLLPFGVWIVAAISYEDKEFRNKILLLQAFGMISLLVFLVVSPTPPRVIYQSYIFFAAAFLLCIEKAAAQLSEKNVRYAQKAICVIVCVLVVVIGLTFSNCKEMAEVRENHILQKMESGATKIEIFEIPYEYVYWDYEWSFRYYYYHEEPGDIMFQSLNFDAWRIKYLDYTSD